jgi:hypothetical protein
MELVNEASNAHEHSDADNHDREHSDADNHDREHSDADDVRGDDARHRLPAVGLAGVPGRDQRRRRADDDARGVARVHHAIALIPEHEREVAERLPNGVRTASTTSASCTRRRSCGQS